MTPIDPLLPVGDGHTPLDEDHRQGLKLTYITTRDELNEAEQENILRASVRRQPPVVATLLTDGYLRNLHREMFRDVWTWAGHYRTHETNLGAEPSQISVAVRQLVDDVRAWITYENEPVDHVAVRFHFRLVRIHPFINGNGRHSRLCADYLVRALGREAFTWGAHLDVDTEELRSRYLGALRGADNHGEIVELVTFARS